MKQEIRVLAPTPIELAMMILSILAVAVVLVLQFAPLNLDERKLLLLIDTAICIIFLGRFFIGLARAGQKWPYIRTHWIDLVSSIPAVDILRYGRLFQVVRVLRILRLANQAIRQLLRQSTHAVLATMLVILVVVIGGSSIAILLTEGQNPASNIHTAEDAIWWSLVTISTVGYGDFYPVSTAGRIVSALVIITGVSLFGGVSGLMAAKLTMRDEREEVERRALHNQLQGLEEKLAAMGGQLDTLCAELRASRQAGSAPADGTGPSPTPKTDACD
ncbi:ion transporter [Gallaecimonas xiamenensis]|uniref:Ion transport 2 domain-containing protein n=1 Tax=Gallaecimonas xiamenensis 3-C-1 TaxID=745411 RepID=K2JHY3_9GAMM|nr:ion transporter [Gallaecimonas xiamenensis]EKE70249.1 ion transport 2 domain-containing protein [Gallaecimonas xiamenensis 3-C-1]